MKPLITLLLALISFSGSFAQVTLPLTGHPDTGNWPSLFKPDLSDADFRPNIWTIEEGVLTAGEDQMIFTTSRFRNFILDLEFNMEPGANSGVVVYCSDKMNWIPNSVEIQVADDFHEKWANSPITWQCAAIFGHLPATGKTLLKPGEWNRMTIACKGKAIQVVLNGKPVTDLDMSKWTDAKTNPDGSEIPEWLSKPLCDLQTEGFIGLQGKHAGARTFYRNIKVLRLGN